MTAPEARDAVMRATGYGISASVWAELEAGTRLPSDEQRTKLEAWAGEHSPRRVDLAEVTTELGRIADALRDGFAIHDEVVSLRVEVVRLAADLEAIRHQVSRDGLVVRRDDEDAADG